MLSMPIFFSILRPKLQHFKVTDIPINCKIYIDSYYEKDSKFTLPKTAPSPN